MNKPELIEKIASKSGLEKKAVDAFLDAFQEVVAEELKAKGDVTLKGFGTFKTRTKAKRIGRNPGTGASLKLPAKVYPVFKAGRNLKEAVG